MKITNISIDSLVVSPLNVRQELGESLSLLANSIREKGLLHPLTVRLLPSEKFFEKKYEIIAGQRRFLAMQKMGESLIPCNIVNVDDQEAEEISLLENAHRLKMTTSDKTRAYSRIYNFYDGSLSRTAEAMSVSPSTITRYISISRLPDDILNLLDQKDESKITIEFATELAKLPSTTDYTMITGELKKYPTSKRMEIIRAHRENIKKGICSEISKIDGASSKQTKRFHSLPDLKSNRNIIIPENMYEEIISLIKNKTCGNVTYCE
jgi:ParB family chromosome partitioning protein